MDILDFISENIYIVTAALFVIGIILKQTPKIPNWSIPYILTLLGVVSCIFILGFSINSILQGIITAGISVYFHQVFKQGKECVVNIKKED